jgi:6-phosphogluconolactonase (cycloisomerase 2 family)
VKRLRWGILVAAPVLVASAAVALAAGGGKLSFQQALVDGHGGVSGIMDAWDVATSPDGHSVYVSGDTENTLATFRRDKRGKLHFINKKTDGKGGVNGLGEAEGVAVSPDSRNVYVAGFTDNAIATFKRSRRTGKLKFVNAKINGNNGVTGLGGANGVAVSADGKNVYAASFGNDALVTFKRNRRNGKLKFVNAKFDGVGGVDGLGGAFEVAAAPDGKGVYVGAENDNAVAAFKRNRHGRLSFANAIFDGQGGAQLLDASGIQVSPDNRSVYVSAANSNALDTFKRHRHSAKLTFVNAKVEGQNGVTGLQDGFDLTVSPDSHNVYASGLDDNAVATFKRNRTSGRLRFVNAKVDGSGGVTGLQGAYLMSSSADGRNVYVTGNNNSSVVSFRRHK